MVPEWPRDGSGQALGFLLGTIENSTIVITMLWTTGAKGP